MRWLWIAVLGSLLGATRESGTHARDADASDLVTRLGRGDADALAVLYERHARTVFSLAFRILGDQADAEDVVQEVFAQAWQQAARYDPRRGEPVAWLLNMARSRAIDQLRRRRHVVDTHGTPPEVAAQAPLADTVVMAADQARVLRHALAALPVVQRSAIELAYYEGLSQTEIAERLDEPLGTVKTRVRLGLLKLRDAMASR